MVVHDLNFVRVSFTPNEADSPLFIDAYTVLSAPVSTQGFQSIAGRNSQVIEGFGSINDFQLDPRSMLNCGGQATRKLTLKDPFRFTVSEALDHASMITQYVTIDKL